MRALCPGRARWLGVLLAVWGVAVVGRLLQVQVAQGSKYRARAQRQQERRVDVSPRRGSIVDRNGRELAVSVECSSIYALPDEVERPAAVAQALAGALEETPAELAAKLSRDVGFVWLKRKVDPEVAEHVRQMKLPGIRFVTETRRFYPRGSLAAALLGYVGTDDRGLGGLEYAYDRTIRGKPGEIVALTDARRSTYGEAEAPGRPPEEGASLQISIDSGVQFAVERELAAAVAEHGARSGTAVLLDPWSGEVLAMASVPGFDPNRFNRVPAEARRNRAIADAYEPGSTFKIVTGSLALERHAVTLQDVFDTGDGTIRVAGTTISEADHHAYGSLTLAGIFEHSSNVGIIQVGLRLGARRLFEGATAFGVGRPTGIDLPGENIGLFRPLPRWSALSNASIAMGQEVSVTALQLARIAAVVANGGRLVTPRVVERVALPDGRVEPLPAPPAPRVLSPETAEALRRILVEVVERGTGTLAAIPGFSVAGKTGTAQKAGPGGYQPGRYVPNFVGFVPAESPRLVAVVILEEPHGKYYAREVAAPVFSRIVSQALSILRIAPEEQRVPATVLAASSGPFFPPGVVPASARRRPASAAPAVPALSEAGVPDAAGLSARQALALFARRGMAVRLEGSGFVAAQRPAAGAAWRPGLVVTLSLSEDAAAASRPGRGREETPSATPGP
ncbi:MAG: penicillin-binding transpeptidase domain-containing protein [Acidobacteriota bacterium]